VDEGIYTMGDILRMLDSLLRDEGEWWDDFYADREKPVPFFTDAPDENLVEYFETGQMKAGRVLELGCGPGRNAIYMAQQGSSVEKGLSINFVCKSIFDLEIEPESYDIVYDCGCFHHIPPHRRITYLALLDRALGPDGVFGIVCMGAAPPEEMGGSDISDWQVYRDRSMHGGLGYSKERLRRIFGTLFEEIELREMRETDDSSSVFGKRFLWAGLFRKR
jgi:SAM-dependent methyltransferase